MAGKKLVPTLDLSTLSEDAPIKIDGVLFGVKHPNSISLLEYKQLESDLPRLGHLMVKAKLTRPEAQEATRLLSEVVDVILDAPAEVRSKLKDTQRVQVLDVFTKLRSATLATTPEAPKKVRRRIGARS